MSCRVAQVSACLETRYKCRPGPGTRRSRSAKRAQVCETLCEAIDAERSRSAAAGRAGFRRLRNLVWTSANIERTSL